MNKNRCLKFLATAAIAVGIVSWSSPLKAQAASDPQPQTQQPPAPQTPPQAQAPAQSADPDANAPASGSNSATPSDSAAASADSQEFSGTVVKQGDKYMLQDDSGKMYDIDHQTDVAKFDGKRVRVQGTLDSSGKKIMVK